MAKTAEQKAAKAAAKAESQQLKSAQKAEVAALKSVGATKSAIKAEQKANKVELKALTQAQKSGTYTPRTDLANVRSEVGTYGNAEYAPTIGSLLDSAAQNYSDYNIATVNKRGNVITGVGLDKLVDYQLGKTGERFDTLMNRAKSYIGNTYSLADLEAQGVKLKADKNAPGIYKWSTGPEGSKEITYFAQNPDGTFTGAGVNRVRTEAEDKGFFDSPLGKIILGVGGFYLGPAVGSYLGLGSGLAGGTVGGALVGGTASKLGGSQFLPGAVSGGIGGFGGGGGISAVPGVSEFTSKLPSITDIPGVGDVVSSFKSTMSELGIPGFQEQLGTGLQAPGMDIGSLSELGGGLGAQTPTIGLNVATEPIYSLSQLGDTLGAVAPATGAGMSLGQGISTNIAAGGGGLLSDAAMKALFPAAYGASAVGIAGLLSQIPKALGLSNLGNAIGLGNVMSALTQPELLPQDMGGAGGYAGGDPRYDALIAALSAPRVQPRSLV